MKVFPVLKKFPKLAITFVCVFIFNSSFLCRLNIAALGA